MEYWVRGLRQVAKDFLLLRPVADGWCVNGLRTNLSRLLTKSLLTVVVIGYACAGSAATLKDVRVRGGTSMTRVVLEFDAQPHYKQFSLNGPDRLVIDIEKGMIARRLNLKQKHSGLIREIRMAKKNNGTARVVLELSEQRSGKVFYAPPAGQNGHRLVVEYTNPVRDITDVLAGLEHKARPVIVSVDAGHGGEDPGAIGPKGTYEKTVVLKIAKRLAKTLNRHPGIKAMLTRESDIFIPLKQRREIAAKQHRADLFISIHADAALRRSARGASVFALSHGGKESHLGRLLAAQANQSDLIGGVAPEYSDPELKSLLFRLAMESNMTQSLQVGKRVLGNMGRFAPLHKSSVEQAGFAVLKNPNIPSILVETGFISNPKEERALLSVSHQAKLAESIKAGVVGYFERAPLPGTWFQQQFELNAKRSRYTVAAGDTLSAIAHRYRLSVLTLKRANNLSTDRLRIGQVLTIPSAL